MTTTVKHRSRTEPSGTEPTRAKSARDLRLLLCMIYAPVFLIGAGLLAWWASDAGPDGTNALSLLAGVCAVLFVVAAANAAVLLRRGHHPPADPDGQDSAARRRTGSTRYAA